MSKFFKISILMAILAFPLLCGMCKWCVGGAILFAVSNSKHLIKCCVLITSPNPSLRILSPNVIKFTTYGLANVAVDIW